MDTSVIIGHLLQMQFPKLTNHAMDPLEGSKELFGFLNDLSMTMLFVCYNTASNTFSFQLELGMGEASCEYAILTKLKPAIIDCDNFGDLIRFVPIKGSPLNELYQTIHSIYSPLLEKYSIAYLMNRGRNLGSTKIKGLLSNFEAELVTSLHGAETSLSISSFGDECAFWSQETLHTTIGKKEKDRAIFFRDLFNILKGDFDRIQLLPLNDLLEVVEKVHDTLDDIWRQQDYPEYPQERMRQIFGIVVEELLSCVQSHLAKYDLMKDSIGTVPNSF